MMIGKDKPETVNLVANIAPKFGLEGGIVHLKEHPQFVKPLKKRQNLGLVFQRNIDPMTYCAPTNIRSGIEAEYATIILIIQIDPKTPMLASCLNDLNPVLPPDTIIALLHRRPDWYLAAHRNARTR
jgi:hypothetical protein